MEAAARSPQCRSCTPAISSTGRPSAPESSGPAQWGSGGKKGGDFGERRRRRRGAPAETAGHGKLRPGGSWRPARVGLKVARIGREEVATVLLSHSLLIYINEHFFFKM